MKPIIALSLVGLMILPMSVGAISVRTEHRASSQSGGVTVTEGSASATGNQSSFVNVNSVVNGTRGSVQIVRNEDGVQTTETHTFPTGTGGVEIVTPTPTTQPGPGRTPRERNSVAVQSTAQSNTQSTVVVRSNSVGSKSSNTARTLATVHVGASNNANKIGAPKSVLALAQSSYDEASSIGKPHIVSYVQGTHVSPLELDISHTVGSFISRLFLLLGLRG